MAQLLEHVASRPTGAASPIFTYAQTARESTARRLWQLRQAGADEEVGVEVVTEYARVVLDLHRQGASGGRSP